MNKWHHTFLSTFSRRTAARQSQQKVIAFYLSSWMLSWLVFHSHVRGATYLNLVLVMTVSLFSIVGWFTCADSFCADSGTINRFITFPHSCLFPRRSLVRVLKSLRTFSHIQKIKKAFSFSQNFTLKVKKIVPQNFWGAGLQGVWLPYLTPISHQPYLRRFSGILRCSGNVNQKNNQECVYFFYSGK